MKQHRITKILTTCIALLIVLTLGITSGCGGTLGCLGCLGLYSGIKEAGSAVLDEIGNLTETDDFSDAYSWIWEDENDKTDKNKAGSSLSNDDLPEQISNSPVKYSRYDTTYIDGLCEELTELAKGKDFDAIKEVYQKIYDEECVVDDNYTALNIEYYRNFNDTWADEMTSYAEIAQKVYDEVEEAMYQVCIGPCADEFKEFVGEKVFEELSDYDELTDEEIELNSKVNELVAEYDSMLEELDSSGGMADEDFLEKAGPIYQELVQVRTKIAQLHGYDNYADYADAELYNRDYTTEDAEKFHAAVKQVSQRMYNLSYNTYTAYMPYLLEYETTCDEMLEILGTCTADMSDYAEEAYQELVTKKLYDIGDEDERLGVGFTTYFNGEQVPFIEIDLATFDGLTTIFHEFGHFVNNYKNEPENILIIDSCLDLDEIHSTGFNILMSNYYYEIYGNYGSQMMVYQVINLLEYIYSGCIYDEFQREVYENPDMTYQEINEVYQKLYREYSGQSDTDYSWLVISHNFESPMYYISYASSAFVSLQIWLEMQNDYENAVEMWEQFIDAGDSEYGYMELLDKLGYSKFTDGISVSMTCDTAIEWCEEYAISIDAGYGNSIGW